MTTRYEQNLLDRIIASTDVSAIIGRYTTLRARGKRLVGLCPFHKEKTPSFTVDPVRGLYYCFGCHAGGSIFQFLIEKEGISFSEAVETLARDAGISIPRMSGSVIASDSLYESADFSMRFFKKSLAGKNGEKAIQYLSSRGISTRIQDAFSLGWAPQNQMELPSLIEKSNLSFEPFLKIGIVAKTKADGRYFSTISDSLVIPITNQSGKVVAFAHRKIVDDPQRTGPKYINSPESDIYHKSMILYGLPQARSAIRSIGVSILVEGYFDVMALVEAGIENVVATCGTALTPSQSTILFKYAPKIVVLYDSDEAGLKATIRSINILLSAGHDVFIARLPKDEDPDSFVRRHGSSKMREIIDNSPNWFNWLYDFISGKSSETGVSQVIALIDAMSLPFASMIDKVAFEIHIRELSKRLGIAEPTLRERLKKSAQNRGTPDIEGDGVKNNSLRDEERLELSLISAISKYRIFPVCDENPLSNFPGLWDCALAGKQPAEIMVDIEDERVRACIAEFVILPDPPDLLAHVEPLFKKIMKKHLSLKIEKLEKELKQTEKTRDMGKAKEISQKILEISGELSRLNKMKPQFKMEI